MDTCLGAVCIADVHLNDATAFAVFDDLNMRQRARDAVAHVGKAASARLSAGAIRLSEDLWEQAGIAGLAIGQQDQAMAIRQSLGTILQQAANKALITLALDVRDHKLADRVYQFRFPHRLSLVMRISMPLVPLQRLRYQFFDALVMKRCPMLTQFPIQAPYHAGVDLRQPCRGLQR